MQQCWKCKVKKEFKEFNKNKTRKNGYQSICRLCSNQITKKHYKENKEHYIMKAKINNAALRKWFLDFKSNLFCLVCRENHPACLDFHHRDPKEKDNCVFVLLQRKGKQKALEEIKKCDVLCANCHRKLHFNKNRE